MIDEALALLRDQTASAARILILDDEPANVEFLTHVLGGQGYGTLLTSTNAREAAAALDQIRPDLVVLDLMMPGFDGFQFMERLKEWTAGGDFIPVLVATADTAAETRRRALAAGAADFLTKPLSPAEVRLRVRNLVHLRSLHRELREQNARLEERVTERTAEVEAARQEVLERLARAAEYRDDDTGQHTQRVGRMAARMAQILDGTAEQVALIRQAAPLHDIGKIGIPDAILMKPGRLTPEERATMETHTTVGARILSGSRSPILRLGEEIAMSHHERWDGAGYPNGLKGDQIPLSGRIVAVADVFDSLTHVRPYKRAWTIREALTELQDQAGRQFDPAVVEAAIRVAPEAGVLQAPDRPSRNGGPPREQLEARLRALEAEREDVNRMIRHLRRDLARAPKSDQVPT